MSRLRILFICLCVWLLTARILSANMPPDEFVIVGQKRVPIPYNAMRNISLVSSPRGNEVSCVLTPGEPVKLLENYVITKPRRHPVRLLKDLKIRNAIPLSDGQNILNNEEISFEKINEVTVPAGETIYLVYIPNPFVTFHAWYNNMLLTYINRQPTENRKNVRLNIKGYPNSWSTQQPYDAEYLSDEPAECYMEHWGYFMKSNGVSGWCRPQKGFFQYDGNGF